MWRLPDPSGRHLPPIVPSRDLDLTGGKGQIGSMHIETDFDVAIAGGGLTGATLALALDQAGFSVALVDANRPEAMESEAFDGRASAIAFTALRQWRNLGLDNRLQATAQPMERIVVTDGRAPGAGAGPALPVRLSISSTDLGEAEAGEPLGWIIENTRVLGEDIGSSLVLDRYARWRRLDVTGTVTAADLIARVFSSDHDSLRWLRGLALGVADRTPAIRRVLAREAGAAAGDLPRSLALG